MKKIKYVDETTFEETIQEFDDFQCVLANVIGLHINYLNNVSAVTDAISNKEGDKLMVGVIMKRNPSEDTADKYRITIEKL